MDLPSTKVKTRYTLTRFYNSVFGTDNHIFTLSSVFKGHEFLRSKWRWLQTANIKFTKPSTVSLDFFVKIKSVPLQPDKLR